MAEGLRLRGVTKSFGPNRVLRGVDLDVAAGEVVALMGANGAGKSTLVKVIGGVHRADSGSMSLNGRPFAPTTPAAAAEAGVVTVHQAINDNVVLTMSVAENLCVDALCRGRSGLFATRGKIERMARSIAERAGLGLPLNASVAELSLADRQLVAIARALALEPELLILDEPTSALSSAEAERLFGYVERLRGEGVAVLYVSHRTSDIERLADRAVTLRDGEVTGDFARGPKGAIDHAAAVNAMLGQAVAARHHAELAPGAPVLELDGLKATAEAPPLDLTLHAGEVTALVGLVGAGKSELGECLFGLRRPLAGTMRLKGDAYAPKSPGDAVEAGVHLAAEDRASDSIVPDFDIARTMSLPFTRHFSAAGFLRPGKERASARAQIERLNVVCQSETDPIGSLSGGNQQKTVLGRWLTRPCHLLILDEPFQGVDIKARADIGAKLRETATDRATLLLLSDLDEALEAADRVLVISHGAVVGEHRASSLDRGTAVAQMAGAG